MNERIAVIGLGRTGMPLALKLGERFADVVAFDTDADRIVELQRCTDRHGCVSRLALEAGRVLITADQGELRACSFFIISPCDVSGPDLSPIRRASAIVGKALSRGAIVVLEATVYPGVTEEVCGVILERESGLTRGKDFKLGYSPERVNPGDSTHRLEDVVKVVSGEDAEALERIAGVYGSIIDAGIHRATSIKVAEASKVIENTQRDLNIALVNELAIIFDRMGISTHAVLAAASTKWNFPTFSPGLVGGPFVGTDPQYLAMKAQQLGYQPEVILAGRRINDSMGEYIAQKMVKLLIDANVKLKGARVAILGLSFKEDCGDIRNTKVPGILQALREFGIEAMVHDPFVRPEEASREYGLRLTVLEELTGLDAVIVAVGHKVYRELGPGRISGMVRDGGVLVDLKGLVDPVAGGNRIRYWSL